jgi:hypothetical protein
MSQHSDEESSKQCALRPPPQDGYMAVGTGIAPTGLFEICRVGSAPFGAEVVASGRNKATLVQPDT